MTEFVSELSSKNFKNFIAKGDCVVDFYAEWCVPCQKLKPVFEDVAKTLKEKTKFGKMNIDGNEEVAQEYIVMSVPTLIFFKNGKEINRVNGFILGEELKKIIKATFK
ncbi:MAG: thioredoxin [Candidatus Pacearchaeota archaeon]|nr:thioredoxin [Candidatus Pacearchaeota archaeon]